MRRLSYLYLKFSDTVDRAVNAQAHTLAGALTKAGVARGITDVVPGYSSLLIEFDTALMTSLRVQALVEEALNSPTVSHNDEQPIQVGVVYGGPDLHSLAQATDLSADEVIKRHSAVTYHAYAAGFTPGFVYLGEVDPAIRHPRRARPRAVVPAGSVGIADSQTGVYPLTSPGGWNIIGRATVSVYDPRRPQPSLIRAGSSVRFVALPSGAPPSEARPIDLLPTEPVHPLLTVRKAGLLDLLVDEGRFNVGHIGFARSGALDPVSAQIARGLVANRPYDPVLEMNMLGPTLETVAGCVVAFAGAGVAMHIDGEPAAPYTSTYLRAGQLLTFPHAAYGCRGYLAVAGGFESDTYMGSASVDARGLIGRPLREGDVLGRRRRQNVLPGFYFRPHSWNEGAEQRGKRAVIRLRLLPGPQFEPELLAELTARPLRIEHSDRMGVRLETTAARGGGVLSEGNPLGAVQLTAGGEPLILLNDRGTMGGYTKPAVVHPRDLPLLAQARDGTYVQLVAGTR